MTATLAKTVADFETTLASAVSIGDTTCTLVSIEDEDGVNLASGTYAFTVDIGNSEKEYFTGILSGTSISSIKSITRQGVQSTGFVRAHRRGANIVITDWVIIKRIVNLLDGTTDLDASTPLKYDATATLSNNDHLATVGYVLSVVVGGAVTFDKQVISVTAGETIVTNDLVYLKESDSRWWKVDADTSSTTDGTVVGIAISGNTAGNSFSVQVSGIVTGLSGLTANSKYYASGTAGAISLTAGTNELFIGYALTTTTLFLAQRLHDIPTAKEKDALVGTQGVPSSSNKFVTNDNVSANTTDQSQTTQNATLAFGEASTTGLRNKIAQSFVPTKTKIRGVYLWKEPDTGTFTGTVTVSIQADSSGEPSGSALATVTITNAKWFTLQDNAENFFEFASEYASLTVGSTYWIVAESSTADSANHPNLGTNSAGGYSSGSVSRYNTDDGWDNVATIDLYFKTIEGLNSQVVKTDSSGDIPLAFFNIQKMPVLAYWQYLTWQPFNSGGFELRGCGSNMDGSVLYLMDQTIMARWTRDANTGMYVYDGVSVTPTITGTRTMAIVVVGDYVYLFKGDGGASAICYRYDADTLNNETLMAFTTPIATGVLQSMTAWTDGNYIYVVKDGANTTYVESISGTTFTQVSTNACNAGLSNDRCSSFFDGTNVYVMEKGNGSTSNLYKLNNINGSTLTSTTTLQPANFGTEITGSYTPAIIANIDTYRMYVGYVQSTFDDGVADEDNAYVFPITKP